MLKFGATRKSVWTTIGRCWANKLSMPDGEANPKNYKRHDLAPDNDVTFVGQRYGKQTCSIRA